MTPEKLIAQYKIGERVFSGADLREADLCGADLCGADLREADLRGANLCGADMRGANLRGADLRVADLRGADLRVADLCGANLRGANLPSPVIILLASWGAVSNNLCSELMRYDAANHPHPEKFISWALDGGCPYSGVRIQRCANFCELKVQYKPGPTKSAFELMVMVLREKCSDSDYHDHGIVE